MGLQAGNIDDEEFVVPIRSDGDMNHARMIARETCKLVELRGYQAQRVVTAVSELARNIARYAGSGQVSFRIDTQAERILITARDEGPGIPNLDEILSGDYRSKTGLGRGILGTRQLADDFDIETSEAGTTIKISFGFGSGRAPGGSRKSWTK